MKIQKLIPQQLSNQVLMLGVYYKHHAPGGMAAVIQYYEHYFEKLHYVCTWKDGNKLTKLFYFIQAYFVCLFKLTFNAKIKIVHIHTAADASFWRKSCFIRLAKFFNRKVILHVHASRFKDFYNESNEKKKIIQNILLTDVLIVLSKSWKEWFQTIGIPEKRIIVLNNIVDYPQIETKHREDDKMHLLFLGEIGRRKGVFDVLKALVKDKKFFEDRIVFKIGGNKMEKELTSFIKDNHLQNFVNFEGWVSGDKKIQLLNWADVFILPSFNEGLPISILEAMSYGCAIISTPVGGILEILHDNENGIVVKPGDIESIGNAVKTLIQSSSIKQMGEESKQFVLPFLPQNVFDRLVDIYKTLL